MTALGHAARSARNDVRIVRALDHDLGPPIQLEAVQDQEVGPAHLDHEARPDLEIMGVLAAAGQGVDVDEVAADDLGERLEVGRGRDHADLGGGFRAHREEAQGEQKRHGQPDQSTHGFRLHQNGCEGWAPRMNVDWKNHSSLTRALPKSAVFVQQPGVLPCVCL